MWNNLIKDYFLEFCDIDFGYYKNILGVTSILEGKKLKILAISITTSELHGNLYNSYLDIQH